MPSVEDRRHDTALEPSRPSRVRFAVLGMACGLAVVTYIHRVGFATASAEIKEPLGLSNSQVGALMAAFMIAYGLFEMPWGSLGDRWGVRGMLTVIILGGSALTAALPMVALLPRGTTTAFALLLLLRFLFGAFQAGTFPIISRMVADWIPVDERGGAQGLLWMSSRLGGSLAPSLLVWMFSALGDWKLPLVLVAGLGIVWCGAFWPWFRNRPEEMASVNAAELEIIGSGRKAAARGKSVAHHGKVPWSLMLGSRSVAALCLMYGFLGYSGNFFITLLPTYLTSHRGLDSRTAGWLTSLPFACGVVSCLAGGSLSDFLIRHRGPRWGRSLIGAVGMAVAAAAIVSTTLVSGVWALGLVLCLTFIGNDLAMGPAWAAAADIGGKHTGVLSGAMNMTASLAAAAGALTAGQLFEWNFLVLPFVLYAGSYLLGAVCWLGVDVTRTLEDQGLDPKLV